MFTTLGSKNNFRGKARPKTSTRNQVTFRSAVPNELYSSSFPREMKVTLKYSEFFNSTSSAGLLLDQQMNLNSIYDPNRTGTGHQAQAYDQWALFYNRYRVDGCRVTVTWTVAPNLGATLCILGSNDTTSIVDPSIITESPMCTIGHMAAGGPAVRCTKYFDLAALNGVSRSVYNADDRYSAPFGSSPTETIIAHIGSWENSSFTYSFHVQMEFYTTLFDPVQLPLS